MATVNTVTDKYILQAQIDDQTAGVAEAFQARLAGMEAATKSYTGTAKEMSDRLQDQSGRFNLAAAAFERVATKYDAVTKAAVTLAKAQQELNVTQEIGNKAVANGYATQEQLDATMAALAKKVSDLAAKLGEARAAAQANAEAQDAWNGKIAGGAAAVKTFAEGVANAAQMAKEAQNAFSAWLSGGLNQDAGIQRFNQNLQSFVGSLQAMKDKLDPASAATTQFKNTLKDLLTLQSYGIEVSQGFFKAVTEAAQGLKGSATDLAAMAAAVDPVVRAEQAYLQKVKEIKEAVDARAISQERGAERLAEEAAAFDKAYAAVTGYTEAQQKAKAAIEEENARWADLARTQADYLDRTAQTRAKYDEEFAAQQKEAAALAELTEAAQRYGLSMQWVAEQMEKVSAAVRPQATNYEKMRASVDAAYAAQLRFNEAQKTIQELYSAGKISYQEMNDLVAKATDTLNKSVGSANNAAAGQKNLGSQAYYTKFATQQAGVQMIQFFSQVASGQPVMLSLLQQFHQIIDVMMVTGTGLGTLVTALKNMFVDLAGWIARNPLVAAIVAVGAAIVYMASSAESSLRQLEQLRATLSGTREDFIGMSDAVRNAAKDAAAATQLSRDEATQVATSLAQIPGVASTSLSSLTTMVGGLARVLGGDLARASHLATTAITEPAKAAIEMASADKPLRSMNAALLDTVLHLAQTGDKAGATKLVLDALGKTAEADKENLTPLQTALQHLSEAFRGTAADGKSWAQIIGDAINSALAAAIDGLAAIVKAFGDFRAKIATTPPGVQSSGTAATTPDATGRPVLVNPQSGTMGLFQVLPDPGTTKRYGYDLRFQDQNILAGFTDLMAKLKAANDNVDLALKNYGGFKTKDPSAYIAAVHAANPANLAPDVAAQIEYGGQLLGADEKVIRLAQQIALVESGGHQYGKPLPGTASSGGNLEQFGPPAPSPAALAASKAQQEKIDADAAEAARKGKAGAEEQPGILNVNKAIDDQNKLLENQKALRDSILQRIKEHGGATDEDKAALDRANRAMAQTQQELVRLKDPMYQQTAALQDQTQAAAQVGAADAALAAQQAAIARQRKENPSYPISEVDAANQIAATQNLLTAGATKFINTMALQEKQQDQVTAGWQKGTAAANDAQAGVDAYNKALEYFSTKDAPAFEKHAQDMKTKIEDFNSKLGFGAMEKQAATTREAAAATQAVADAWDGSAVSLDHLQNRQKAQIDALNNHLKPGTDAYTQAVNDNVAAMDAASAANRKLQQEEASVSATVGIFTNAFDQLGQSLSDAFLNSSGKAINWGNILKSVFASVIAQIVKLGVVAPIVNNLFNQNNPTLWDGLSVLSRQGGETGINSATSGGGGSSLSLGNLLSLGKTGYGIYDFFAGGGSTSIGTNSLISSVSNYLPFLGASSPFYGGAASEAAMVTANSLAGAYETGATGAGLAGSFSGAAGTTGAGTLGGISTLGGFAGGVGGGFALGSLAGGLLQRGLGKVGPAPTIGAGAGAVGGAIAGQMLIPIPGVGALIGGLLGGLLGGGGGGLIGPHLPSAYSSEPVSAQGRQLVGGRFLSQLDPNAQQEQQAFGQQIAAVNQLMATFGLILNKQEGVIQLGINTPGKFIDPTKYADLQTANVSGRTALSRFGFTADNPLLAQNIAGRQFATIQDLQTYLQNFTDTQAAAQKFLADTTSLMKDLGVVTGSVNDTIKQLNDSYAADKTNADALINSGFLSPDQVNQMVKAEGDLASARDKAILQAEEAAQEQLNQLDQARYVRRLQAQATISGTSGDALGVQLVTFDAQAQQQRKELSDQLVSLYGDTVKTQQRYANEMTDLETTLGQERVAIITQYNRQIAEAQKQVAQGDIAESVRYWQAHAQITGFSADAFGAQIYAFDVQAQQQREALDKQLVALYGDTIRQTQGYANEMAMLEQTLGKERVAIVTEYNRQIADAQAQVAQGDANETVRYWQAYATVTGDRTDALKAQLYAFDVSAGQQRQALDKQLVSIYGTTIRQTQGYANEMSLLEQTLGEERLAIVKQSNAQIAQASQASVANLQSYIEKLMTGNQAPLSPQSQYTLASKQFNAVFGAARAGDYNSIQNIQTYADALLQASSAMYGTGTQYVADFNRVLNAIQSLVSMTPDELTAAVYRSETRSQTQQLVDSLTQIRGEVAALRKQIAQGSAAPLRLAS